MNQISALKKQISDLQVEYARIDRRYKETLANPGPFKHDVREAWLMRRCVRNDLDAAVAALADAEHA